MTFRSSVAWLLLTLASTDLHAQAPSASEPLIRRSARAGDFQAAKLPWNTFTIDLPDGWPLVPGWGAILVSAAERGRGNQPSAAIVIEHTQNIEPLSPSDVDERLAALEADWAHQRDPAGQNFEQHTREFEGRRFVIVQYRRAGFNGPDRVTVYVLPAGKVMYRLICIAPDKEARKYQEIFAHVAASFKPSAAGAD
jgi:hypothetical protein